LHPFTIPFIGDTNEKKKIRQTIFLCKFCSQFFFCSVFVLLLLRINKFCKELSALRNVFIIVVTSTIYSIFILFDFFLCSILTIYLTITIYFLKMWIKEKGRRKKVIHLCHVELNTKWDAILLLRWKMMSFKII